MQIPIVSGIFSDQNADFRTSYPRNMVPVPKEQGISEGYLRPADGIVTLGAGPGVDRGGINWNGVCYRVQGSSFIKVGADGSITNYGDVGAGGPVSMDYSFDRLAIASAGKLYYFYNDVLHLVTDPDLGIVLDVKWIDGYFMTTDGTSLVVTDLTDPNSVNPLHYGSSEVDPDPIVSVQKLRDEPHAVNRYTIEVFNNIGGVAFPFQRNEGAQIQRGAVGTHACCVFTGGNAELIAFVGGARNEPCAVWVGANSQSTKISTREIDTILQEYSESQLAGIVLETRIDKSHQLLYVHLPDQCLVYDAAASQAMQIPVWYILTSSVVGRGQYRARGLVWCYGKWIVGDPTGINIGVLDNTTASHHGDTTGWDFQTTMLYNESKGAQIHRLELVALPGRVSLGDDPVVWTSYSIDGETWSQELTCPAGMQGDRLRRITWLRQGFMRNWRTQKFRGTSDAFISFARLEAEVEPLNA